MPRTITPKILCKKDTYEVQVSNEMISVAQDRCRPFMRNLIDGRPLTDVLIKAYLQGFVDCYKTGEK
jgi:hypothetical protein